MLYSFYFQQMKLATGAPGLVQRRLIRSAETTTVRLDLEDETTTTEESEDTTTTKSESETLADWSSQR